MMISVEPLTAPDAGDYQRMGLRAMEYRPLVIRRALERSAAPLALMHLRSPNAEVERMLVGVLVSAYRILDPRRRDDVSSRSMLGRIHPMLAEEAVLVAHGRLMAAQGITGGAAPGNLLSSGGAGGTGAGIAAAATADGAAIGNSLPPSSAVAAMIEFDRSASLPAPPVEVQMTSERFLDSADIPGWDTTLSSPDLLVETPLNQHFRAARRRLAGASPISLVAASMLAASVLMVVTWRTTAWLRGSADIQIVAQAEELGIADASAVPTAMASVVPSAAELPDPATLLTQLVEPEKAVDTRQTGAQPAEASSSTAGVTSSGDDSAVVALEPGRLKPELQHTAADAGRLKPELQLDSSLDELELALRSSAGEIAVASESMAPSNHSAQPADDVAAPRDAAATAQLPSSADLPELVDGEGEMTPIAVALLPKVPPESQYAAARLQIEKAIREEGSGEQPSATAAGQAAAERRIAALLAKADAAESGSAERYVALMMAGQTAVLAGLLQSSEQAIGALGESFDIEPGEATLTLARWAAMDVVADPQRPSVAKWIDERVRTFVLGGDLATASQLASVAQEFGNKHRDEAIKGQSKLWRDALAVAQRYAEAARRVEASAEPGQMATEERSLAGRYYALVRRDWHRALPHLAAGAHAKLAHLAGIELLAGGALDAQDATLLADGYVAEAKRAKGWLADSYILHAHELLIAAAKGASETKALELTRTAEKLKAEHARAFTANVAGAPQLASSNGPTGSLSPRDAGLEALPAQPEETHMLGRVRVAGQDAGVLVRYEPAMVLSGKVIDQLASQLALAPGVALGAVELDFVGVVRVERPTTVALQLLPLSDGGLQQIAIDGQVLPADSATTTTRSQRYEVDLLRGEYVIRWTATLGANDHLSIRVLDAATGAALPVSPPPATMPGHPAQLPTRLRVSLVKGEG